LLTQVNPQDIEELCSELKKLLDAELSAGNEIVETWRGWPKPESIGVMLSHPFKEKHEVIPSVVFREIDDRHWWKAEYYFEPRNHILACRF
jgi:hypothetical protein